jgi:hypothetical protein
MLRERSKPYANGTRKVVNSIHGHHLTGTAEGLMHIITLHVEGELSDEDAEALENDLNDLSVDPANYPTLHVTYVDILANQ